ncbi:MAG: hypothetical protein ACRC91_23080 [Aeromonas sp.]
MKISNSKKELARIIRENGGWRGVANLAVFGKVSGRCYLLKTDEWPEYNAAINGFYINSGDVVSEFTAAPFANWHQTILSREEYFRLYPAPDDDGWIEWHGDAKCPVYEGAIIDVKFRDGTVQTACTARCDKSSDHRYWTWIWSHSGHESDIIAYRLHKPEQSQQQSPVEMAFDIIKQDAETKTKPTIEQLAADYRSRKDYASRKQKEAYAAKADADAALSKLELAGEAIGLIVTPVRVDKEPELVITDWLDLQVGDEIEVFDFECHHDNMERKNELMRGVCVVMSSCCGAVHIELKENLPKSGQYWNATGVDKCKFKFVRRP